MPEKASDDVTHEGDEKQGTDGELTVPVPIPKRDDTFGNLGRLDPKHEIPTDKGPGLFFPPREI